jgi:hypothetical protein
MGQGPVALSVLTRVVVAHQQGADDCMAAALAVDSDAEGSILGRTHGREEGRPERRRAAVAENFTLYAQTCDALPEEQMRASPAMLSSPPAPTTTGADASPTAGPTSPLAPGNEEHWVCLVRSTGDPVWERLPGTGPDHQWTRQDTDLPGRLRFALAGDRTTAPASAAEVAALARDLYAQRLAPLDRHLKGVHRLFVVPVGAMSGVPVEVLSDRYRVSYVPSGTFLARLKDRPRPSGDRVLAVGDPRFDLDAGKPKPPGPLPSGGLLVAQVLPNGAAFAARIVPGDVLLTYASVDLKDVAQLRKLLADHAGDKTVTVTVWRDGKTAVRELGPGTLGVVLARDPAPLALADKRKADQMLAAVRGGDWKELPGLKEFRYLHFATHGEANQASAFQSRLVLAQDAAARAALPRAGRPTLDGYLTAREVLDFWELDADLVTLSACETALGRAGGGDGQLGFAQAFLTAGSRATASWASPRPS